MGDYMLSTWVACIFLFRGYEECLLAARLVFGNCY